MFASHLNHPNISMSAESLRRWWRVNHRVPTASQIEGNEMIRLVLFYISLTVLLAAPLPVEAQQAASSIPRLKTTKGAIGATPLNAKPIANLGFSPQALDAKPLGRVSDVNVKDGRIASIEIEAGGFLGYFVTTYEIPADWLVKRANRVELLLASNVTFQFEK